MLSTRERSLVAAVNATRALHALPKLGINWRLTLAARSHSQEMLRWGECAHGNFSARMSRFHVRGHVFAETLDCGSGVLSARAAVADWLASPPHRAILLDPALRRIGLANPLGAFFGFPTATLVTADFAGG